MEYTQPYYDSIEREYKAKLALLLCGIALLLAGGLVCLYFRLQLVCMVASAVGGCLLVFFSAVYFAPVRAYRRFLRDVLTGHHRQSEGSFVERSEDTCNYDHVRCLRVILLDDEGYERHLYWDAQRPFPDVALGARVRVRTFGQMIVGMESVSP